MPLAKSASSLWSDDAIGRQAVVGISNEVLDGPPMNTGANVRYRSTSFLTWLAAANCPR